MTRVAGLPDVELSIAEDDAKRALRYYGSVQGCIEISNVVLDDAVANGINDGALAGYGQQLERFQTMLPGLQWLDAVALAVRSDE